MGQLDDSIQELKGIGPSRYQLFQKIGIESIEDLLFHFPFRYENIEVRELETVLDQEKVSFKGKVVSEPVVSFFAKGKNRLAFRFAVSQEDVIQVVFFNQHYLKQSIEFAHEMIIYGKWDANRQSLLGIRLLNHQSDGSDFTPIYSTTKGLSQKVIQQTVKNALELYRDQIEEIIPDELNDFYGFIPLADAVEAMHFPKNQALRQAAERKIIYQELFLYQWKIQLASYEQKKEAGIEIHYDVDEFRQIIHQSLPFELTKAQKRSVNEICRDLLAPYPMKRMLQGDVGSGKTLVAFLTMIAAVISGYQTALMVPTEILAKQHVESFNQLFEVVGLKAELLTGSTPAKEKTAILQGLASGRIRIVIGTHALIQADVHFKALAYAIIDEQHRFGVQQRQALLDKSFDPTYQVNLLQMTATPIPRSLALTLYGETAISTIDEYPKNRQTIDTYFLEKGQIDQMYQDVFAEVKKGHQVYYVLPMIESSDYVVNVYNVNEIYQSLKRRFPDFSIAVLHGQLSKQEQEAVMDQFIQGQLSILIATTMVEVGIDVPNATIMIIQSAERFGLAQLHQLRGRVGRGAYKSRCYLIGSPTTEQGKKRLEIMSQERDGFLISQEDLRIRGIGDVLGYSQSGLPSFAYANIIEDQKILQQAQDDVRAIINQPELISQERLDRLVQWSKENLIEA